MYVPRSVRFLGLERVGATTLKVYGIGVTDPVPSADVRSAALRYAAAAIERNVAPRIAGGRDWSTVATADVGSLVVHTGRDAVFVLLDVWVDENILRHHVWIAPLSAPTAFESLDGTGVMACVWEMVVLQHERDAWVRHALRQAPHGNLPAYLADVINGDF